MGSKDDKSLYSEVKNLDDDKSKKKDDKENLPKTKFQKFLFLIIASLQVFIVYMVIAYFTAQLNHAVSNR